MYVISTLNFYKVFFTDSDVPKNMFESSNQLQILIFII